MDDEAGRLVDDDDRVVLVDDRQRHRLRRERELLGQQLGQQLDRRAERHGLPDLRRRAADAHAVRLDPLLQAAARELGKQLRERLVEALARERERHVDGARRIGAGIGARGRDERVARQIVVERIARRSVGGAGAWAIIVAV